MISLSVSPNPITLSSLHCKNSIENDQTMEVFLNLYSVNNDFVLEQSYLTFYKAFTQYS